MHYFSSVYSVTIPLHVSDLLVVLDGRPADSQLRRTVGGHSIQVDDSQLIRTTRTNCHIYIYTLLPPDDGLLAGLKHVKV
jgi:hypothetical protein